MGVSNRHIFEQGAAIGGLSRVAFAAIQQQLGNTTPAGVPDTLPGPDAVEVYAPRSPELVKAYARHVGGDASAYKRHLPAHLFPQWGFGIGSLCFADLGYPMAKVLNAGCRMEMRERLPINEELNVRAHLKSVDDDGKRAVLTAHIITGTASAPDALACDMTVLVPLGGGKKENGKGNGAAKKKKKESPRVPVDAKEISYFRLSANAGMDFAKLTGDFNPVHWVPGYARAMGFKNVILHGFATMARAIEGVNRGVFSGDVTRMKTWECRFTKTLVLPARVGLYVSGQDVFVGDGPGGPAYLVANYTA